MCATFTEVANMVAHNIESSNLVFNWIENVREDLSKAIPCGDNEVTIVTSQGSCSVEVETVRDPVARRRKGRPPCQRKKSNKFSKSKMNSSRSNAKNGRVNEQVPTVIPTHENNVITAFQNLEGSCVDMNMYPHGVLDYCNGLMSLHHMVGDNVYPTPTQNSCMILEKQLLTVAKAVEEKLDEEIAAIDRLDDDDLEALRERRLQQMKKMAEKRNRWISLGHGDYSEIQAEKDFFSVVKASDRVVCHFYRENWPCKVMDKHMSILAKKHIETRFVKIHAEKSPFLAERLKIVVLPTLALIKNAKVDDYVVGFDELGGTDEFSTEELEERLAKAQVIFLEGESSVKSGAETRRSVRQGTNPDSSDSE
ncbi:Thioredoxin domain-containing protein 9-like [Citrus sinensis]|nr:Thioredoxin domain-containing protein 9-like [Citrus sinensis]